MTSSPRPRRGVFADPVYGTLDFGTDPEETEAIKRVVNSQPFQRLRRISQLGLASYVFPNATHTRFVHSLGAAYLARLVLQHLREWHSDRSQELKEDALLIMLAALLHDVGHGPFSHSFERAIKDAPSHEEWTATIVRHRLRDVLGRYVDVDRLSSLFGKKPSWSGPTYLKQIVSSQIDVDRLDYLRRDAHFSGVPLGNVDVHYLIRSLVIVPHGPETTLGISSRGIGAYEAFAMARHFMNRTLYFHRKVRVLEFMMELCLREAVTEEQPGLPAYLERISGGEAPVADESHVDDYLKLTEDEVWAFVRRLAASGSTGRATTLAQRIVERRILPHSPVLHGHEEVLKKALKDFDGKFAILPTCSTVYKVNDSDPVFVLSDGGQAQEVSQESFGVSVHSDRKETSNLLVVVSADDEAGILATAREANCIADRPARPGSGAGTGPGLSKAEPDRSRTKLVTKPEKAKRPAAYTARKRRRK